jgi:regulator of sigma E protease
MSVFITILIFLAILVVVILVHELGHFITAKLRGVRVEELGLGFPPRILSFKRGDTVYSLNLIPIGGFCRMSGEEDPNVPGGLAEKSIKTRFLILSAGSLFMLLLPLLLLPMAYMIPMARYVEDGGIRVTRVAPGSPAEAAGIESGDIILSVDGQEVKTLDDIEQAIEPKPPGSEVTLLLLRDDTEFETSLIPRPDPPEGEGPMGVELGPVTETRAYPPWEAIPKGLGDYGQMFVNMKDAIAGVIQGQEELVVVGPIGIAQLTGEVAEAGVYPLILFAALLSMILAIVNLLPIPALDGGRIALLFLEVIRRGKRISPRRESLINMIGFALLITLLLVVSYNDILRIIQGGSMLP